MLEIPVRMLFNENREDFTVWIDGKLYESVKSEDLPDLVRRTVADLRKSHKADQEAKK
jgi:hypothetical protein